jgi:hypothetical protein
MAFLSEVMMFIISYLGIILIFFFLVNWLQGGLLIPFIRVKISRGRLVLVKVRGILQDYYRVGHIDGAILIYSDKIKKEKQTKRLNVPEDCIFRSVGVNCIEVDNVKNAVVKKDFSVVSGFDAVKIDNYIVRALTRPTIGDDKMQKIMLIIAAITFLAVCFAIFKIMGIETLLRGLTTIGGTV